MRVKIVVFVPVANAHAVRDALGAAGAGKIGEYSYCSYSILGKGRFMPSDKANPHIGNAGVIQAVEEERIEVECDKAIAKEVITAMKAAHPYEEVAFDMYPLLDVTDL